MLFSDDREQLRAYLRRMADLMGLCTWVIVLSDDDPPDDRLSGACSVTYGRHHATIWLAADWAKQSPDALRNTVVHELLHAHIEPIRWTLNNVQHIVSAPMFQVLEAAFVDAMEMAVDALATAWAETLPLPEIPQAKEEHGDNA